MLSGEQGVEEEERADTAAAKALAQRDADEAERAGPSTFDSSCCAICNGRDCCIGRLKSLHDFKPDKLKQSKLWQMTEAAGFEVWFLPK